MSLVQRTAAWIVTAGFLALGLAYLNGAVFSAWVAGGPPGLYPTGWERRALGQLGFSLGSFILAVGSFRLIGGLPQWRRGALVVVFLGIGVAAVPYIGRLFLERSCLSQDGEWSNLTLECTRR
jgi:hypothetical protein